MRSLSIREMQLNRNIVNLVIAISLFYSFSMSSIAGDKSMIEMGSPAINKAENEGLSRIDIVLGERHGTVEHGDLVTVKYSLKEDNENGPFETITLLAGQEDTIPAIHNIVTGMKPKETKSVTLTPEEAYGPLRADRILTMPLKKVIERRVMIHLDEFRKRYGYEPQKEVRVGFVPYFTHTVANVEKGEVILYADLTDPFISDDSFGKVSVIPDKDTINIILEPKLGAPFSMGSNNGYIVSSDKESFSVDFNHPLAGKSLVLNVTVDNIKKASEFKDNEISWSEDHLKAIDNAKKKDKPLVLILSREGCPWCERLFDETMEDPRVINLDKEFVWAKMNGEKYHELMDTYEMDSYPSIVILNKNGEVIEKIAGYQSAPVLRDWLNSALNKTKQIPVSMLDGKRIVQK
ncbi:MAG: thioredoxin fold domain-containing protein [Deltaproteobacteria bacterium]|nr:thioredoxin fold domain-containing protein [Deltaproteobacteria bacterium]